MKSIHASLLSFILQVMMVAPVMALQLQRSLPADELRALPGEVRVLVYTDRDTPVPHAVLDFGPGQFHLETDGSNLLLSAELPPELETEGLWIETEFDGELKGERMGLAVATPGVTFASGNALDMDGNPIHNLATPGSAADAANKAYVDGASITGNAATATALAADPADCPAGSYAMGIGTDGAAEGCTPDATDDSVQSGELDALCDTNGSILRRTGSTWGCATDADSLADLACADGELPKYDGNAAAWQCGTDHSLSEADVELAVTNGPLDLDPATTLGGDAILTAGSAGQPFAGQIMLVPWDFCPVGWVEADGRQLNVLDHVALFSLLGTRFGGTGTTFNLPDLRSRLPLGTGQGSDLSNRVLGQSGGVETVTLTEAELPSHRHTALASTSATGNVLSPAGAFWSRSSTGDLDYNPSAASAMATNAIGATGGGQAHSNMPPFLVLRYCIALQGQFPLRP